MNKCGIFNGCVPHSMRRAPHHVYIGDDNSYRLSTNQSRLGQGNKMAPKAKRNQARIGQLFSVDKKQSALLDSKVARKVEKDADIVDIKLEEPEKVVKAPKVETEPKQSRPRLDVNDPRYLRALEKATEEELCEPSK